MTGFGKTFHIGLFSGQFMTGFGKTFHIGFIVKIEFDASLIALEIAHFVCDHTTTIENEERNYGLKALLHFCILRMNQNSTDSTRVELFEMSTRVKLVSNFIDREYCFFDL